MGKGLVARAPRQLHCTHEGRYQHRRRGYNVFETGFNDQILRKSRSLNVLYRYIRENPYRLAIRRAHPNYFYRSYRLTINDIPCRAYGNIQLLNNPFKDQVVVHRADTDAIFERNKSAWIYTAANGGVLISPFISRREKDVRNEADMAGGRFILIAEPPIWTLSTLTPTRAVTTRTATAMRVRTAMKRLFKVAGTTAPTTLSIKRRASTGPHKQNRQPWPGRRYVIVYRVGD